MGNDILTREHAEAEVYKLAASVVEKPRHALPLRLVGIGPRGSSSKPAR